MKMVVGVDKSPAADAALKFACSQAIVHDAELVLVHTWDIPYDELGGITVAQTIARLKSEAEQLLRDSAAQARRLCGDAINIRSVLDTGPAAQRLLSEAKDANLIVVGSRGRGDVRSFFLGSAARFVWVQAPPPPSNPGTNARR